jgi:hypothetical protein
MPRHQATGTAVLGVLLAGVVSSARADWPLARHDGRRTGQASGQSDIAQPVAYWKRYIGGELDGAAFMVHDVDGDGAAEVLMIAGGSAVAKRRTDAEVWRSPNLELIAFVGLVDLDGDGGEELIARSDDRVFVLDPASGAVRWAQPQGEMGTIGGARLGDVDGDGLADVVEVDCVCCQVRGQNHGFVYSFASGAASPIRRWQFPSSECGGGVALTLVDSDGDGDLEILHGSDDSLALLDGRTGAELARTPALGTRIQRSRCLPYDLVGGRGDELVCVHDADTDPEINERTVFALRRLPGDPILRVVWRASLAPVEGGALSWLDLVNDLDGDGRPEVTVSSLVDGVWSTHVLDAVSGARLDSVPGELLMGTAPMPGGGNVLLTSSSSHLSGWSLSSGDLTLAWTALDAVVAPTFDLALAARGGIASRAALARIDGDQTPDVVAMLRSAPGTLVGYRVSGGDIAELARYQLPPAVEPHALWPLSGSDDDLQLALAQTDGFLTLFDLGLVPAPDSQDDVSFAHLRTGGYYARGWPRFHATPRSARLGGDAERLFLVDSRGSLLALDAELGSFAAPPRLLWQVMGAGAPAVVPHLDGGRPGVACLAVDQPRTSPPTYSALALRGDGSLLWRQPAPADPFNDIVPGDFDGDGGPDLVFQWGDPGDVLLRTRAIAGTDGRTLWESDPVDPGSGRKPAGVAVARFDGDDGDDVYHQAKATQVLSGANGTMLASSGPGPDYALPTLVDVDGNGNREIVLHGGPDAVRVLDDDLASTLYRSPDYDRPFPYGAVADCGEGRQVLAVGSAEYPSRLKLTELSGPAAGEERILVLAAGALYADEAGALEAGALLGQLASISVHQNLTGAGRPSAVVGSSDGWLYAVDPCRGSRDFAYQFGAAVGEAIFGDTDGDGRDEILVTVEDGYLYTLRNFEIAAPADVRDTDPWSESGADLAELVTRSTLEATWSPVDGAVGYQVAVVDAGGNYLGEPWRDAGTATRLVIENLPLEDGETYRISVRAITPDRRTSVDTVSNGVWVHLPEVTTDDRGGCCNSSGGAADALSGGLILALFALRRRRGRRS